MLEQYLARLPKSVLGLIGIIGGLALLLVWDPPKTVCDIQLEIFKKSQNGFLYQQLKEGSSSKLKIKPQVERQIAKCAYANSMGGCFEYFNHLKKLNRDLRSIPRECSGQIQSEQQVKKYMFISLQLMIELAWGDRPPISYSSRNGWFQWAEVALFCETKKQFLRLFGQTRWKALRKEMLGKLPGAKNLSRNAIWGRSIMSTACELYH